MLKIYDRYKNPLGYITKYTDLCIESELSTADKSLSFTYRVKKGKDIKNEYYVETKEDWYVVKEVGVSSDDFPAYTCQLDLEDLEAEVLETFSAVDVTLTDAANLALAGTGWTVDTDITKKRSVGTMKVTPLSALKKIKDAWMCEMCFDTKNKVVFFREQFGEDKGVFFTKSLNLRKLDLTSDTYDYYTRIIPIGAKGLRIRDVNDGKDYVENYQYSSKVKTLVWEDTNYKDAETLKEDAEKKLDDMSKPAKSYSADIVDLAAQRPEYAIMSFRLGDTILLLDEQTGTKEKQRIVKLKEYPQKNGKNSCELSNTTLTFEEMQDRLEAAAKAVEDITNADGTVNGYYVHGVEADGIVGIETVINGSPVIQGIHSQVSSLSGVIVDINGTLNTALARIGTLETTSLTATEADLKYATIENLKAVNAEVGVIKGDYADFKTVTAEELAAQSAIIKNVQGDLANYKKVIADELVTAKGWMLEGAIGDAQISDLSANKIKAGTIDTALVTVASADGAISIAGNQIMVNDAANSVNPVNRVILGKYLEGETIEYGLLVRGADGQTIMIDGNGVHNAGITDGAIDNNKVADDANIAGNKLDINSVVTEINGATEKISSTVVQVGNKTLQVTLTEQENMLNEHGETLTSQAARIAANEESIALKVSTQEFSAYKTTMNQNLEVVNKTLSTATADISVLKGQIALKVEQTDIEEAVAEIDGKFASYSTTTQMNAAITAAKDNITSTVSQTYATKTELTTEAGKISVLETWKTEASQKITKDGIISTVGNYYAYESDLAKAENRITAAETSITQHSAEIALTVKKDDVISSINQSAESVAIQASKIKLEGLVTANNNFKILTDGSIEAVNGKFAGAINIKKNTDIIGTWNETGINIKNYLKEGTKTTLDSCFEVNTADGKSTVYIGKKEVGYCNEYGVFISPDDPRYVENDGRFRFFTEYDPEYDRTVNGLFFGNSAWLCSKVDSDYPYKFIIDDLQAKQVYAEYIYADTIDCPSLNSKLTSLRNDLNNSVNGIYESPGRYYLNKNMFVTTFVRNPNGNNYLYAPQKSGYRVLAATNGDFDAWNGWVRGVARQGATDVILLNAYRSGVIRIDAIYMKVGW